MREKIKEIENSQLLINEIVEQGIDEHGREVIQTRWFELNKQVNLGSISKPNTKVLSFKYKIPQENSFLKGLFGG